MLIHTFLDFHSIIPVWYSIHKDLLSAGEKQIFALSLIWGLGKLSLFELPIIIDTPLSRLDWEHSANNVGFFYKSAARQVIILPQDREINKWDLYYNLIKWNLVKEMTLVFDSENERTVLIENHFEPTLTHI